MSQDWTKKTYSLDWLREQAKLPYYEVFDHIHVSWFLVDIGVVPRGSEWKKVYSTYPVLDRNAIRADHLISLALEWDREGLSPLTEWLDMVELECSPKRDRVIEALERVSELSS